ncbi:MAG: response regulator transcription factor [Candidatus Sulfotelmatobacter sp.]
MDDNAVMRHTLRNLLESQNDLRVCDEAVDGGEAVAKFDKEKFDVVMLDFQMPGMNGLDAAKQITSRSASTPVLMVKLDDSPQLAEEARKVGIRAICPKADIGCVVEGVTTILDNKSYFKLFVQQQKNNLCNKDSERIQDLVSNHVNRLMATLESIFYEWEQNPTRQGFA